MDMIKCSSCGKEIPSDTVRCGYCGQIQGFSMHKIDGGLKPRNVSDAQDLTTPPPEPPTEIKKVEDTQAAQDAQDNQEPATPPVGRISRLKTILTGKDVDADLDNLRQEGLLPDEATAPETAGLPENFPRSASFADKVNANNLPDWLRNSEFNPMGDAPQTDEETAAQGELAATMGEIPDWVRKLQEKIERRGDKSPEEEPSRPAPEPVVETNVPQSGAARHRRAAPKVELAEADAGLIESVTAYIGGLKTPRKNHPDGSRRLSRSVWGVIGLAMFSLAAAMLWSGSSVAGSSQPAGAGLAEMTSRIDSMPPESVVLIGMDYDLSLAGEINNVALPVLVHLMSKQVSMVFVPTRPTGSAMAKLLIETGKNWLPEYPNQKTFVLSFIPGGAAGLLQLATDLQEAVPVSIDGTDPWVSQELVNIRNISDFSFVLILTDSANSGKDWIEQVQPRLAAKSLYVIASRQAEPILEPYLKSGQIQAMVAGISDGATYERVHLFTTNNQQMLKAYHGVLLFMAVLLACVIVLSIFPQNPKIRSRKGSRKHAAR
jgi:hypothetical protein